LQLKGFGCHVLSIVPVPEKGGGDRRYWQQKNIAAKFALSRMRSLSDLILTLDSETPQVALEKLTRMDIMGSLRFCSLSRFYPKVNVPFDKSIFCLRNQVPCRIFIGVLFVRFLLSLYQASSETD